MMHPAGITTLRSSRNMRDLGFCIIRMLRDIKTKFAFRQIFVAEGAKQGGIIDCQEEEDEKLVFQSSDDATICRRQKITTLRSSRDMMNYMIRI